MYGVTVLCLRLMNFFAVEGREERRMRRDAGTSADINGYMEDLHGMLPEINTSCDTSLLSLLNNSM
ncbi:hypothetical protein DPMN_020686 [Dreissena polymorpha]|uniref:Uncharacterized protein n=1 Tax=Dreissena polymorpha TaxID=45954 RepID=A0A9D4H9A9_DREPO|nr:hypothetical protein DPMN_131269 [Dreissena polymorpha]KAH3896509.1 hypothetical protein DPMN_020686 [Dreissena polymorpha]